MNNIERENRIRCVVEEYGDLLFRLALHYVKSVADAEDVLQEVLLAYLIHAERGREKGKEWLLRVTVNKSIDFLRKRKHLSAEQLREEALAVPSSEYADLYEDLQRLSAVDREIVYLYYYAGYSSREIAKMLHRSDTAIRKRLERAKKQLRVFLEEE